MINRLIKSSGLLITRNRNELFTVACITASSHDIVRELKRRFSTTYEMKEEVDNVTAEQFFTIVRDVPSYPAFLKWISGTVITSKTDLSNFSAEMGVDFMVYKGVFESKVTCKLENEVYRVVSLSEDSPVFEHLNSDWSIRPIDNFKCEAIYKIDFKFKNLVYQSASSYFVGVIGKTTMKSFVKRAKDLHERENIQLQSTKGVKLEQSGPEFEFLAKTKDIEIEILIFQTVEMLSKEGFLSPTKLMQFKELYFSDKSFAFEIKTLFQTYPTRDMILLNKERILFLIYRHLSSHVVDM